ncbi:helix-turn-helix domain-containing protein [Clostridium sp. E02]|uniref:helix-turn-helix domain-containing protein n=1 Tax=Clostridium sp. E02 TaxID=2487134 RepID=UPI000F5470A0|nr:helix-turn-helix domain-containing protein [Clostridium sp. E02]
MKDYRFQKIYEEGSKLFINQGYSRTQIRDIVKVTGISTGALYSLFVSKKAILFFILKCTIEPDLIKYDFKLPIDENTFTNLEEEIMKAFDNNNFKFGSHLENDAQDYSYETMLSDAFDILTRYGVGCLFIENNPKDSGRLWNYYIKFRQKFFDTFSEYIQIFIERGTIRQLLYPQHCTRLMIETLSWWGMHVHLDAFEVKEKISVEIAKKVSIDSLIHSYKM